MKTMLRLTAVSVLTIALAQCGGDPLGPLGVKRPMRGEPARRWGSNVYEKTPQHRKDCCAVGSSLKSHLSSSDSVVRV